MDRSVALAIDIETRAAQAVDGFDDVGSAADRMASTVDDATRKADVATSRFDSVAESSDKMASSSSQAAGGLGDLGGALSAVPGPLGAVGSGMEALAPAIMGVTGASDLLNLVTESSLALKAKDVVLSAKQRAATILTTGVTKTAAVAQRILNAAMRANPIGLVITALTLLVAGFVLAYKKSETFRNIVNGVMDKVRDAIGWVVDKVDALVEKVRGPLTNVWDGIKAAVKRVADFVKPIIDSISNTVDWLVGKWKDLVDWIDRAVSKAGSLKVGAKAGFGAGLGSAIPGLGGLLDRSTTTSDRGGGITYAPQIIVEGLVVDPAGTYAAIKQLMIEGEQRFGNLILTGSPS